MGVHPGTLRPQKWSRILCRNSAGKARKLKRLDSSSSIHPMACFAVRCAIFCRMGSKSWLRRILHSPSMRIVLSSNGLTIDSTATLSSTSQIKKNSWRQFGWMNGTICLTAWYYSSNTALYHGEEEAWASSWWEHPCPLWLDLDFALQHCHHGLQVLTLSKTDS